MEFYTLNDGYRIPAIGFGTSRTKGEERTEAVLEALRVGYRLIDTAASYGNEEQVGEAIRKSGIPRDEIFLTSKLRRDRLGYHSAKEELDQSLERLGVDYLDLYLIHWPANSRHYEDWVQVNSEAWRALEESKEAGKIRSIGVSNFWPEHLEPLLSAGMTIPAINQIEFHPGYWQPEVYDYCEEKDIRIQAWAPLARGRILDDRKIRRIADRRDKTPAQICLRWVMERGVIPIPKSSTPERIRENLKSLDFRLRGEDIHTLNEILNTGFSGELPNEW